MVHALANKLSFKRHREEKYKIEKNKKSKTKLTEVSNKLSMQKKNLRRSEKNNRKLKIKLTDVNKYKYKIKHQTKYKRIKYKT